MTHHLKMNHRICKFTNTKTADNPLNHSIVYPVCVVVSYITVANKHETCTLYALPQKPYALAMFLASCPCLKTKRFGSVKIDEENVNKFYLS